MSLNHEKLIWIGWSVLLLCSCKADQFYLPDEANRRGPIGEMATSEVTVCLPPPSLSESADGVVPTLSYAHWESHMGTVGQPLVVEPVFLDQGRSPISDCHVLEGTTALPDSLRLDPETCVITGLPTATHALTYFEIIATNEYGTSVPAYVLLGIEPDLPTLSYAGSTGTAGLVGSFMTVTPLVEGNGSPVSACFLVMGTLPAGLSLSAACTISGVPLEPMEPESFQVQARNDAGYSAPAHLVLSVSEPD